MLVSLTNPNAISKKKKKKEGASGGTRLQAQPTVGNRAKSAERPVLDGGGPGDTDKPGPGGGSALIEGCPVEGCCQIESMARKSEG